LECAPALVAGAERRNDLAFAHLLRATEAEFHDADPEARQGHLRVRLRRLPDVGAGLKEPRFSA
jgi:hypothetical protein